MAGLTPIAITGLGCLSGAGMNLVESLECLFRNERHPHPPFRFSTDHPVSYPVLELRDDFKLPLDAGETVYARTSQLALVAAFEANMALRYLAGLKVDKDSLYYLAFNEEGIFEVNRFSMPKE